MGDYVSVSVRQLKRKAKERDFLAPALGTVGDIVYYYMAYKGKLTTVVTDALDFDEERILTTTNYAKVLVQIMTANAKGNNEDAIWWTFCLGLSEERPKAILKIIENGWSWKRVNEEYDKFCKFIVGLNLQTGYFGWRFTEATHKYLELMEGSQMKFFRGILKDAGWNLCQAYNVALERLLEKLEHDMSPFLCILSHYTHVVPIIPTENVCIDINLYGEYLRNQIEQKTSKKTEQMNREEKAEAIRAVITERAEELGVLPKNVEDCIWFDVCRKSEKRIGFT